MANGRMAVGVGRIFMMLYGGADAGKGPFSFIEMWNDARKISIIIIMDHTIVHSCGKNELI